MEPWSLGLEAKTLISDSHLGLDTVGWCEILSHYSEWCAL
jgi:hypothetical protein